MLKYNGQKSKIITINAHWVEWEKERRGSHVHVTIENWMNENWIVPATNILYSFHILYMWNAKIRLN